MIQSFSKSLTFEHMRFWRDILDLNPNRPAPEPSHTGILILDSSAPELGVGNKCLLFVSLAVYGILSCQPNLTVRWSQLLMQASFEHTDFQMFS